MLWRGFHPSVAKGKPSERHVNDNMRRIYYENFTNGVTRAHTIKRKQARKFSKHRTACYCTTTRSADCVRFSRVFADPDLKAFLCS